MAQANIDYQQLNAANRSVLETGTFTVPPDDENELGPRVVPREVRTWLGRLRLLQSLPFTYVVPDAELLPLESIRFFHLDRSWTDALVQGALSVGTVSSADRSELESLYDIIRDEVDEEERVVRLPGKNPANPEVGVAGPITGFLLRSRAVSAYPGLHVRAYRRDVVGDDEIVPEDHPDRLGLLRLERLAPAVLLALFDGLPEIVHLEEPRAGIQFGVRLTETSPTRTEAWVPLRDPATGVDVEPEDRVPVSFRPGSPGVLDLQAMARELQTSGGAVEELDGAELALQMVRYPFRQIFGDEDQANVPPMQDVFRPTVGYAMTDLADEYRRVQ